ncbi:thymidylate synthase [Pseudoalteromonas distincta]|uniref:thymidylate synthase n=1 Tax=Pseudoalteromonas distincta TaxID=77608 RepID=UPI0032184A67
MRSFSAPDFVSCYIKILENMHEFISTEETTHSRVGDVYDLGPCSYEFEAKDVPYCNLSNRELNPFFALVECAWVLAGSNKLAPLKEFISHYHNYSDDNNTLYGAYGYRIFKKDNTDQVAQLVNILKNDPESRRAVLSIYSPEDLYNMNSKDIPCNTSIYFKIRNKKLDMTVLNRSNDLFLGVPYNVLVFNSILKFIASQLNIEVGKQLHFSDSLHLYKSNLNDFNKIIQSQFEKIIYSKEETNVLFDNLIEKSSIISNLDFDNLSNESTLDKIFKAYFEYKNNNFINLDFLHEKKDIFSISACNWLLRRKVG